MSRGTLLVTELQLGKFFLSFYSHTYCFHHFILTLSRMPKILKILPEIELKKLFKMSYVWGAARMGLWRSIRIKNAFSSETVSIQCTSVFQAFPELFSSPIFYCR
jgi:hypothetical protein